MACGAREGWQTYAACGGKMCICIDEQDRILFEKSSAHERAFGYVTAALKVIAEIKERFWHKSGECVLSWAEGLSIEHNHLVKRTIHCTSSLEDRLQALSSLLKRSAEDDLPPPSDSKKSFSQHLVNSRYVRADELAHLKQDTHPRDEEGIFYVGLTPSKISGTLPKTQECELLWINAKTKKMIERAIALKLTLLEGHEVEAVPRWALKP